MKSRTASGITQNYVVALLYVPYRHPAVHETEIA